MLSGRRRNNSDAREVSGTQRSQGMSLRVSQCPERSGSLVTADLARQQRATNARYAWLGPTLELEVKWAGNNLLSAAFPL